MRILQIGNGSIGSIILDKYHNNYDVDIISRSTSLTLETVSKDYDIIFLAIKPQQMDLIFSSRLKRVITDKTIIISILAGFSIERLSISLETKNVIRVMPNIGIKYNLGVNLVVDFDNPKVEAFLKDAFGDYVTVDEKDIDIVTPITGCGSAYFLQMASIITEEFSCMKLSKIKSNSGRGFDYKNDVILLLRSAAAMLEDGTDIEKAISTIASKGGITEAALIAMEDDMRKMIDNGLKAGLKRAKELNQLNN